VVDVKETNPKFKVFIDGWLQLPNSTFVEEINPDDEEKDSRFGKFILLIQKLGGDQLI
jgi:hypothetical protein